MRVSFARAVLLAPLLAGCGTAAPAPGSEPATTALPIAGGTLDTGHPAVFEEFTHWGSSSVSSCTASLIAENVLLTARHCIANGASEHVTCGVSLFQAPIAGSATIVTPDAVLSQTSLFYRGADIRVPADGDDMCGYDIALIILQTPIPPDQVTPLVPRIDQPVEPGEPYVAVGYGLDAKGQENPGRMVLGDLDVRCLSDECEMPFGVAPSEFMGAAGICSGDSGGPALDNEGRIIGVVSRGSDPCSTPIYSQVAPWRDFITQTVLEAAATAGYRAPFWAFSGSSELPAAAHEGEPCSDSSECAPGMVCYYDSTPADAACTPVCANSAQCRAGQECRSGFDVEGGGLCFVRSVAPPASEGEPVTTSAKLKSADDGACALSGHPSGGTSSTRVLALALGLMLFRLRRTLRH